MADNLLDKASILLTPTAYRDGGMLSVKPENGDGDFTFSRSSAATRVNAQGLVENVQIISSELVSNGNFSQIGTEEVSNGNFSQEGSELVTNGDFATDSDWGKGNDVNISGGSANWVNAQNNTGINQVISFNSGSIYKFKFTISNYSSGAVKVRYPSVSELITSNGDYTFYLVADQVLTQIYLQGLTNGDSNINLSIDNVSVKEVGQDWILGSGWSIGGGKAISDGTSGNLDQSGAFLSGKTYKVVYTIEDYVSGDARFRFTGTSNENGTLRSANGIYTEYITLTNNQSILRFIGSGILSITNISVKEVGQDWTFGTGWSMGDDKAVFDTTSNASLLTNLSISSGNLYRLKIEGEVTSGNLKLSGSSGLGNNEVISLPFEQDILHDGGGNTVEIRTIGSAEGFVTNISVKEITDDTDLPRINYEGFSYQDSLGSELIVNGDFATDTNWTKASNWTISGGSANADGSSGGQLSQTTSSVVVGKTYKIQYTILNYVSGSFRFSYAGTSESFNTSNGTYTTYRVATSTANALASSSISFIGSIDNVSVKEYLGQEVVPDSGCGSWLLEPQSTNLITHSSDLTPWWSASGATIENTSIVSPDGTQNVKSVKTSSTGTYQGIFKAEASAFADKTLTLSVFAKKSNNDYIFFYNIGGVQGNQGVWFNISDGTIGTNSSGWTNTKIENYGNGWYRCSSTLTFATSGQDYIYIQNSNSDNNINSDINKETYIWGTQLEEQSYATSYIPTNGATNTRLQDIATNSGNSTLINSTEGVLYAEIAALADDLTRRRITISDGTTNNRVNLFFENSSNTIKVFIKGVGGNDAMTYISSDILQFNKVAVLYKDGNSSLWVNGVKRDTSITNFNLSNLSILDLSQASGSGEIFYGKNKALAVFKEALTDAQLQSLTTI